MEIVPSIIHDFATVWHIPETWHHRDIHWHILLILRRLGWLWLYCFDSVRGHKTTALFLTAKNLPNPETFCVIYGIIFMTQEQNWQFAPRLLTGFRPYTLYRKPSTRHVYPFFLPVYNVCCLPPPAAQATLHYGTARTVLFRCLSIDQTPSPRWAESAQKITELLNATFLRNSHVTNSFIAVSVNRYKHTLSTYISTTTSVYTHALSAAFIIFCYFQYGTQCLYRYKNWSCSWKGDIT